MVSAVVSMVLLSEPMVTSGGLAIKVPGRTWRGMNTGGGASATTASATTASATTASATVGRASAIAASASGPSAPPDTIAIASTSAGASPKADDPMALHSPLMHVRPGGHSPAGLQVVLSLYSGA